MADIDNYDTEINQDLDKLEKDIIGLSKKDYEKKKTGIKKCELSIKQTTTLIEQYELEISNLDKQQSVEYIGSFKAINVRFKKLKADLESKRREMQNQNELFQGKTEVPVQQQLTSQAVVQMGHEIQADSIQRLQQMGTQVNEAIEQADKINLELDRQIEQLDRMYNTVKDTQSVLKRTNQLVNYFARSIYTDKCLLVLIVLVFIAIVVTIVLASIGKIGGSNNPIANTAGFGNSTKL